MWELNHKESWVPKNWCFWTVLLEKTPESPLDCKEIQPVHPKGDQSWMCIGRTDAKAETPILWPPDVKSWLIGKDPDAGKRLRAGGEGDNRGWDGWMASPTQWAWVCVNSRSWWWTRRPGVLRFMGSQRVGCDWLTELNWTKSNLFTHWFINKISRTIIMLQTSFQQWLYLPSEKPWMVKMRWWSFLISSLWDRASSFLLS